MQDIKNFKEQIADIALNISRFSKIEKSRIVSGLMNNVSIAVNIAVLDKLSKEDAKKLVELSKSKNKAKALKYANSKIKNLSLVVTEATRQTIEDFNRRRMKNYKNKNISYVEKPSGQKASKNQPGEELKGLYDQINKAYDQ